MDARTKHTALVVDDNPRVRALVAQYLEAMGFAVSQAADGREGIRKLEEDPPTLLCLDLMLPEASGFDVCEHMRATAYLRDVPIIMISGRELPEDRATAEELGVRAYLVKPFTQEEFHDGVERTLRGDA